MTVHTRRLLVNFPSVFLVLAFLTASLPLARPVAGESTVTMVGTVTDPATVSAVATGTQTLAATRYDLRLGSISSDQTWAGASVAIYLSRGRFATAPSVAVTDSSGAAVSTAATAIGLTASNGSIGGSASYQFSGDLPNGAVLHMSGIAVTGFAAADAGTEVQIVALASGSGGAFRQYATWQTLATIDSGGTTSVTPESGWWWSSSESGRGYAIEVADGRLMLAAYMYRSDGTSVWYVANGPLTGSEFTGTLTEYQGGGTLATWRAATELGSVATVQIDFSSTTTATIRWTGAAFGASGATTAITRYAFTGGTTVTAPASPSAPATGWYWNAEETGAGWFLEMQGSRIFLALYMYEADGTACWYVAQGTVVTTGGVFGSSAGVLLEADLFEYADGQTLSSGPRTGLRAEPKGEVTVWFASATAATVTLPGGRQIALTRFSAF